MKDDHILEYEEGKVRLIILEHDETGAKSVKDIIESRDFQHIAEYTTPEQCVRINVPSKHLPAHFEHYKQLLEQQARMEYIRDCHQAVADAEHELKVRRHELHNAITLEIKDSYV